MDETPTDLDTLTPEQEATVEAIRDRWIQAGLSTEQSTEQQMRDAVDAVYRVANMEPPRYCFFFDSPQAGAFAVAVLQRHYEQFPEQERNSIPVPEGLLDIVPDYQDGTVEIPFDIEELAVEAYTWACYGQHDAGKVVQYDVARQLEDVPMSPTMEALMGEVLHCGWWWAMEKIAVVSRKNAEVHLDSEGRAHNETGTAIKFADQYGLYCIHGTTVPERFIDDAATIQDHDIQAVVDRNEMTPEDKETFVAAVGKLRTAAQANSVG